MTGPLTMGGFAFREQHDAETVPLVWASTRAGFLFPYEADSHPDARITARFTDDAGVHWQIDPDLSLTKQRASQNNHEEIEKVADDLLDRLDERQD